MWFTILQAVVLFMALGNTLFFVVFVTAHPESKLKREGTYTHATASFFWALLWALSQVQV